ncbi:MAG TPA: VIT domain-containing protein [Gemmatimonadales bacterium]|nr:VIT domain-containing protein [Gemmatimonadales bacterium]
MFRHTALAASLLLAAATSAHAQGWIEVDRPVGPINPNIGLIRVASRVRTTIEGRVARVEVEEQFRNTGSALAEGTYLYPLPGEAVFSGFSLWMGDKELRGETMTADQARGIYEEIVRRRRDPALLTLAGHGLVKAQIFPIQPGETRRVVLRYTQVLERAGDALRIRYAIGQRGRSTSTGGGDRGDNPSDSFSWQLDAPGAGNYGTPYSPTHELHTSTANGQLSISLDADASGDVEVFLPLRRNLVGTSLVTNAPGGEDGYFMLLLAPPAADESNAMPRDLTLVMDISGSMSGDKMEQARAALMQALGTLRPDDRFRVIAFSSAVRQFRTGFTSATPDNLGAAREFVRNLAAEGGTNIAGALDAALTSDVSAERLSLVIFLTDGVPSVGEQAPDRIAAEAAGKIGGRRIFTFGVGADVNTYLLDRLAVEGRGSAAYVAPSANVETSVGGLLTKVQHPALVNLHVVSSPVELTQVTPGALPDLFYGEELVVFGRYHGQGSGPVVIEGERNGRRERFTADAAFPATDGSNDFVPRLWASRRIGELTRQARLEGNSTDLVNQIRDLGLRYGIITEYTSYLVQEPGIAGQPRELDDARRIMPSAAPAAQTGATGFRRADASARRAEVSNLAAADSFEADKVKDAEGAGGGQKVQRVGGRLFVERDGVWTDARHASSLRVVSVRPFSEAYFALVRALPELARWLPAGEQVVVAGRRVSLRVAADGSATLDQAVLARTVKDFRGQ